MMKKLCLFIVLLLIITTGAGVWGYQQLQQFYHQPIQTKPDQLLTLERGTTGKKLAALLEQENILPNAKWLPWLLKLRPQLNQVKAGTYSLNGINTVEDLLKLLSSGKEVQLGITFVPGDNLKTWLKQLSTAPQLQQTLADKSETDIYKLLNLPETTPEKQKLEGWLDPETYYYVPNSQDVDLLKRASERMRKNLDKAWANRDPDLILSTPYELLILASIVEKETAVASERPKIASVFLNRLKLKMKLQTDPTVIYGMGDAYQGNIRKKDLEQSTPYNTYVIDGLPPTPIAMPSEQSLMAVANPEKTDFLYFVADGSGGHKFTRNLSEHNRAVQDYLHWYKQNKQAQKAKEQLEPNKGEQ